MMTVDTVSQACFLLSKMPSSDPWTPAKDRSYTSSLNALPDHVVCDVVSRAIATCDARPSLETLLRMAAELANIPIPSAAMAWEEVEIQLITRGLYCDPDPFKPNIFREGEPRFSHPLIREAIRQMGGWRAICTSESGMDYLRSRFSNLYEELVDRTVRERRPLLRVDSIETSRPKRSLRLAAGGRK